MNDFANNDPDRTTPQDQADIMESALNAATRKRLETEYNFTIRALTLDATFCRLMAKVLAGMTYVECLVYMDDDMIYASTLDDHLQCLEVFTRMREHNIMENPKKKFLLQRKATYLDHIVDHTVTRTDPLLSDDVSIPHPAK